MSNQVNTIENNVFNPGLEIALVKIARVLFNYIKSEDQLQHLLQIRPLFNAWHEELDTYTNRTNSLDTDLGLELNEWLIFKTEFCEPEHAQQLREGKNNIDKDFIDNYGKIPENIILYLERKLGIIE